MLYAVRAMTATMEHLRDAGAGASDHETSRLRHLSRWGALLSGILAAGFLWIWSSGAERRAIQNMPEGERRGLLVRTVDNLKTVCEAPPDALRVFCREQAKLAVDFPECDHPCQDLAWRQLSRVPRPR